MNFSNIIKLFLLSVLVSIGFMTVARAQEATEVKIKIPDTVQGVWQAIDSQTSELKKTIEAGKLNNAHQYAFAIRDLVAALLTHPDALPSDKFEEVKKQNKFVETLANRLDENGDQGDKTATETNFKKLQKVLADIRAYYKIDNEVKN